MRQLVSILVISYISLSPLYAQTINKHNVKVKGVKMLYYDVVPTGKPVGILILLPASGEKPENVFKNTALPKILAERGFVTVIPKVHGKLYADQYSLNVLDRLMQILTEQYKGTNFVIGGLSSGGAIATRYTEYMLSKDSSAKVKGLIIVDAPLDLRRIYASAQRKLSYSCRGVMRDEGYGILEQLDAALGGSPLKQPNNYISYSAFSSNLPDGGNAKYLRSLPIRMYTEPDLDFVRKTYCNNMRYDDLNAVDLQRLNDVLEEMGNQKTSFIATKGRGFHSWNIIEPEDCALWIMSLLNH